MSNADNSRRTSFYIQQGYNGTLLLWNFGSSLEAEDSGRQVLPHVKEKCQQGHIHAGLSKGDRIGVLSTLSLVCSLDNRKLVIHSKTRLFQVNSQKGRVPWRVGGGGELLSLPGCQEMVTERRGCLAEGRLAPHLRRGAAESQGLYVPRRLLSEAGRKGLLGVCAWEVEGGEWREGTLLLSEA